MNTELVSSRDREARAAYRMVMLLTFVKGVSAATVTRCNNLQYWTLPIRSAIHEIPELPLAIRALAFADISGNSTLGLPRRGANAR